MRSGPTLRLAATSALLALVVGAAFTVLLSSVAELRGLQRQANRSEQVLQTANLLERLVVDLETGQRGFVITGLEQLLQPWHAARAAIPQQAGRLERLVADTPEQQATARQITNAIESYLDDYSIPLVAQARSDPAAARTVAVTDDGKRRIDAIRAEFDRFLEIETGLAAARQDRAEAVGARAVAAATAGLAGSVLIIVVFAVYLATAIARPVRRAAAMAGQIWRPRSRTTAPSSPPHAPAWWPPPTRPAAGSSATCTTASSSGWSRSCWTCGRPSQTDRTTTMPSSVRSPTVSWRRWTTCASCPAASTRRSSPKAAWARRCGRWPADPASRSTSPWKVPSRLPEPVEVAAYYVVSEALANIAKHAQASTAHVDVAASDGRLHMRISDDGVGGTVAGRGSGLIGLTDRVEALGGTLTITSLPGQGTSLAVDLPLRPAAR